MQLNPKWLVIYTVAVIVLLVGLVSWKSMAGAPGDVVPAAVPDAASVAQPLPEAGATADPH